MMADVCAGKTHNPRLPSGCTQHYTGNPDMGKCSNVLAVGQFEGYGLQPVHQTTRIQGL